MSLFFGIAAPTIVSSEGDVANPRTLLEHDESTSQEAGSQVLISHAGGGGWTVHDPQIPPSAADTESNVTRGAKLPESRDRDHSPPRRRERVESPDVSPLRRHQRHDSPDASPPRLPKAASADLSPSRRRRHDSPDASPPRHSKASVSDRSKTSPPRQRRRETPDVSPIRRIVHGAAASGVQDSSPPRLRPSVSSGSDSLAAARETESAKYLPLSAASTSRRSRWDASADSVEPRVVAAPAVVADAPVPAVRSTGLRDPKQFLAETRAKADNHRQRLASMDDADSGRGAATVVRDSQGLPILFLSTFFFSLNLSG